MKFFILTLCFVLNLYHGMARVMPDRIPEPCSKSVSDYSECTLKYLGKFQTQMINGIRELNVPSFNPFHIPVYSINRTINDMISISAIIKDTKIWGFDKLQFKSFKFNPETLSGEITVYLPKVRIALEYDATGKLLTPNALDDSGHFKGNLSEITGVAEFALKTIEKLGVKYLDIDNIHITSAEVGDANVKLVSNKAENQGVADFIANFVNEDPKRAIQTLSPVIRENIEMLAKLIVEQILASVPADELIPA